MPLVIVVVTGCASMNGRSGGDLSVRSLPSGSTISDGSLVYALPLTVFEIGITADKVYEVPGPYAAWAAELTGLERVITSERETWHLSGVSLTAIEELDPAKFYIIEGTTLMNTNMLALRRSGLVLDINPGLYGHALSSTAVTADRQRDPLFPDKGVWEYATTVTDTAYRLVKADTAFIRVPYLVQRKKGLTLAEEAREAAERLSELREGRHMILTGEANVFPQDGAALAEINRLEREYTALFAGKRWTERKNYRIWVTPESNMAGRKNIIFRFSENRGVIMNGGEEGTPVVMEIIPSGKTRELNLVVRPVTSQKDLPAADRIYYRVPEVAEVRVSLGDESLCSYRGLIYQLGSMVALPSNFIIGR